MKKSGTLYYCSFFICATSWAGILRHDTDVQDYRDFAENLGKYTVGATHIPVYKTDGTLSGYLEFSMPDFGMVANGGYASLISPSYLASVSHNGGYKTVSFGNGAQYAATYTLINRNNLETSGTDFHTPRLNKVVTDAVPLETVKESEIRKNDSTRYAWYTRVGGGAQSQVSEDQTTQISLASSYLWKTGGTINTAAVSFASNGIRYVDYAPGNALSSPLSLGTLKGDSGSPLLVYDTVDQRWKLVGVMRAVSGFDAYVQTSYVEYIHDGVIASVIAANTSPDVTDTASDGTILWTADAITQASYRWAWQGLAAEYKSTAPSAASNEELDATKDLRFNGEGGLIVLDDAVNLGAGKLQFSSDYTLTSADSVNATWVGGGVEVDAGKTVLWQVNGLADDALHKIGDGTLHINATGVNEGSLNTGAGTVILDQQADASGNKQAFSSVTLVSGRPTVVLADAEQVSTENIFFGYRGGTLDLNGNDLSFKKINHTDGGATLVNHSDTAATLTLTGYGLEDVVFNTWGASYPGVVGNIYKYGNPYSKQAEYFQLLAAYYDGYPIDQTSSSTWKYLGTDPDVARIYRLDQINQTVFRGFIGETDESKTNGELNVNYQPVNDMGLLALTGGMNLNGTLAVEKGILLLSGQPVPHAGKKVFDDDWYTSLFVADKVVVNDGATFQVGEYAQVKADIDAGESSRLVLGYSHAANSWRCYAIIYSDTTNCSQPERTEDELNALPASTLTGDITLADNASLYLGKVDYTGAVTSSGTTSMTLDSTAYWQMTGNSNITTLKALSGAYLSMVPTSGWSAKHLQVDSLDATGLTLGLGVNPARAESDRLTIKNSATGSGNILDVTLMLEDAEPVTLREDLVMVDAPGGTAHNYFSLASLLSGFSIYTPTYQVKEEEGRVQWVLQRNQEPEVTPDPDEDTGPEADAETPQSEDNDQTPGAAFNPDDWFTIADNQPLIRDTRALMASRQYIVSEALSQLNDRAAQLHTAPEKSGTWATIENSKGRWQGYRMTQQTLNIGRDMLSDGQMFGLSASYTQGKTRGDAQANHRLASVGLNYSLSPTGSWFIDAASRYMYLNQDLNLSPQLGIQGAHRNSHILAGSLKTGYQFHLAQDSLSLSPYIGIRGGYLSGYRLQGHDAQVSLSSGTPYFATAGLEVKKRGLWHSHPDIMLTGGLEYQYAPGKAGSETVLTDRQGDRRFASWSDNRYRANLGVEGKITDQLTVNAKVKSSFGGHFKTDYSGMFGVSYHF